MSLLQVMELWNREKPLYEKLRQVSHELLERNLESEAVFARVVSRVKDDISLAKKLIRKGSTPEAYEQISDRVGIRIICKLNEDLNHIDTIIKKVFHVKKYEDKRALLKVNEFGYKSLHYDVDLSVPDLPKEYDPFSNLAAEVQVRTLCEDVWAEIHHDLGYKPLNDLPEPIARQMYCLGGLLEVADQCFSRVKFEVDSMMTLETVSALRILESAYFRIAPRDYDRELSFDTLGALLPIIEWGLSDFKKLITEYAESIAPKLKAIIGEGGSSNEVYPYLTQPEVILTLYLVENEPFKLIAAWNRLLPIDDLEKLSLLWGHPLADLVER